MSPRLLPCLLPYLALALCALAPAEGTQPMPSVMDVGPDPALPFEVVRVPDGIPVYVLGVNRFTPQQVIEFLAGIEPFVARAQGVAPGTQLVWRREGLRGYLSVSTSPFTDGPDYLLTLRGEPVRTFQDTAALLVTMTRLGLRVLGLDAAPDPASAGADSPRFPVP